MSEKKLKFTVENTGGVSHAELVLEPGVNVLLGKNGAGKTSCIDAVVRASGGKAPLQRKDGTSEGRVQGPGVTLTVRQVVRTDGRAELVLADVGPLGRLIDPRLKNTDAAARERVRALVELIGVGVDDEKLLALCGGDRLLFADLTREIDENSIDNLLEASEKLRHIAHAKARAQEDLAAGALAEVNSSLEECRAILLELGGADGLSEKTIEQATEELEAGVRTHDRALAKCEAREGLEKKQAEIRESLGGRPDLEGARTELAQAAALVKDRWAEIEELRKREAELVAGAREAEAMHEAADRRVEETEKVLERWNLQQEILEQKPDGPTRGDLDKLRGELVDTARQALERAQVSKRFRDREKTHDEAVLTQQAAEEKAQRLRELANDIPAKLGSILAAAGAPGLTVINGRLHVTREDGPPRDFEHRCSTGERSKAALAVAAQVYTGRVLALDGEVWGGLDPDNRAAFAEAARAHDLCVITEEPAEGPLRVELKPKDSAAVGS